jgi:hypothetical protein
VTLTKITNGVHSVVSNRPYKSLLIVQNVTWFRDTRLQVISFTSVRKVRLSLRRFSLNSQILDSVRRAIDVHKHAHKFFNDRKQNTSFHSVQLYDTQVFKTSFCQCPEFYPDRIKNEQNKAFTALKTKPRSGNLLYRVSNMSIRAQTWTLATETDLGPLVKQTAMGQFSRNRRFFGVFL